MKIQKGHYVPKELITSEVVHEAVVKCFVAAGFDTKSNFGQYSNPHDDGLCVSMLTGNIIWGAVGETCDTALTIQQLFTAENGLQWPENAYQIVGNDHGVWFCCDDHIPVVISGAFESNSRHPVIAYRQPKEKEVKYIKDAVIELDGKWPVDHNYLFYRNNSYFCAPYNESPTYQDKAICSKYEFESEAKRLGYINGYRWGVEYATNGKRPELADDVVVQLTLNSFNINHEEAETANWSGSFKFKITDQRLKPADTNYLKKASEAERFGIMPPMNINERCDLNNWHERGELPPVGVECETKFPKGEWVKCKIICHYNGMAVYVTHDKNVFMDEADCFRSILTEREKVIEAAVQVCTGVKIAKVSDGLTMNTLNKLYSAGMLVLPPKKSDTKD